MTTASRRSSTLSNIEEQSLPLSPASANNRNTNAMFHSYDQWNQIDNWLQDLYAAEVPVYEKDDITLQSLSELHAKTEEANNIMKMVLLTQKQISDENMRQAAMWQEKLDALELSKSSMSNEGSRALDALVMLSIRLGLDNTSLSSYQTALAHLTIETMDAEIEAKDLKETEYALQSRIDNAESELSKMKSMLSSMRTKYQQDKQLVQHWNKDTAVLKQQTEVAKSKYAMIQREYESTEVEQQELRLSAIKKLEQDMAALETVLAEENDIISSYRDLPPDMMLASLKFKETQSRLQYLRQEREQLLTDIANHVR